MQPEGEGVGGGGDTPLHELYRYAPSYGYGFRAILFGHWVKSFTLGSEVQYSF